MSSIKVFDRTLEALSKSLDYRSEKQVIIASNIANAETPGYEAKTIDFEAALANALTLDGSPVERTHPAHFASGGSLEDLQVEVSNQINNVVREDGNTVDRDAEMVALSENQLLYNAAVDLLKKKMALIKYSIADGGNH